MRIVSTHATIPLRTGIFDPYTFSGANNIAYQMTYAAGATYVRLPFTWSSIAPAVRPVGFRPSLPDGYSWSTLDRTVAAVENAGLTPILDIVSPPAWAFAVKPRNSFGGMPKKADLGRFARALATHYDGHHGAAPVHVFQVLNEPNNSFDLWPVKPARYRDLVNAVANAVHAVDRKNIVVAGGLDPFGHKKTKRNRFYTVAPLAFMRSMLCISKGKHPHSTCKTKIHFDVWSHHPYTFKGPFGHARGADDVSLGDLPKMRSLLRTAAKLHRLVSSRPVQFWVTEFSWDTNPPRRHAAPLGLQARWTSESLYQMWRSGVSLVTWFLLQDRPSPNPYQSGLYFQSPDLATARPKPTLTAFRFPFVAYRGKKNTVRVWGRDATNNKKVVAIRRRRGHGRWKIVARVRTNRYGIFVKTLHLKSSTKDTMQAIAPGSGKSLVFSLRVPKLENHRFGPWGN